MHAGRGFAGGKHKFDLDTIDHHRATLCSDHIRRFNIGNFAPFDHLAETCIDNPSGADLKVFAVHIIIARWHPFGRHALFFQNPLGEPFRGHNQTAAFGHILDCDHALHTAKMIRMRMRINHTDNGAFTHMFIQQLHGIARGFNCRERVNADIAGIGFHKCRVAQRFATDLPHTFTDFEQTAIIVE